MIESLMPMIGSIIGIIIGSLLHVITTTFLHNLKYKSKDIILKRRKELLLYMLNDPRFTWRNISTLSNVIGTNEETTKAILLQIGARGSENGSNVWGLIERNPFANIKQ